MNKERLLKIAKNVESYKGEDFDVDLLRKLQYGYDRFSKSKDFDSDRFKEALGAIYWGVTDYYNGNTDYDFGKAYKIIEKNKKIMKEENELLSKNQKTVSGIMDILKVFK